MTHSHDHLPSYHMKACFFFRGSGCCATTRQPMRTKRDGLRFRTFCHIFLPRTTRNALVGDTPHFLLRLLCLERFIWGHAISLVFGRSPGRSNTFVFKQLKHGKKAYARWPLMAPHVSIPGRCNTILHLVP